MAKIDLRQFDYKRVARLDSDMWRVYYEHRFVALFIMLIKLMSAQFGFGQLAALRAAYYAGSAAADYRIHKGRENFKRVEQKLVRFYRMLSDRAVEPFDCKKAAEIELEWWNIHRYAHRYKKSLQDSLAEGMAVIFNGKPQDFKQYAALRAEAMLLRDEFEDKGVDPNWAKIDALLFDSWQAVWEAVQKEQ